MAENSESTSENVSDTEVSRLPQRTQEIITEVVDGIEHSNNKRLQVLMSDQLSKVKNLLTKKKNPEDFDILVHVATRKRAELIRTHGFYAAKNHSTVFTHQTSAHETPINAGDKCAFHSTENEKMIDFNTYFGESNETNFVTTTRGDDWDVITMVVPIEFHKGSTITHPANSEFINVHDLPEDFQDWDVDRIHVIPIEYIVDSSLPLLNKPPADPTIFRF